MPADASQHTPDDLSFRRRLAVAISAAFGGALLIFLGIVMPAEFNRDPLGIGGILGLTGMMDTTANALHEQYETHKSDEIEFILEPFQSLEYKYQMDRGNTLVFSWRADAELYYDLHAENFEVLMGKKVTPRPAAQNKWAPMKPHLTACTAGSGKTGHSRP